MASVQNGVTASGGGCSGEMPIATWNADFSTGSVGTGHRKWQGDGPWSLFQMQRGQIFKLCALKEMYLLHPHLCRHLSGRSPDYLCRVNHLHRSGGLDNKLVCCLFFLLQTAHTEKELWSGEWCAEKPLQKQENRAQPRSLMVFAVCSACVCPCQEMQNAQSSKDFSFCLNLALLGRLSLIKSKDSLHQERCK